MQWPNNTKALIETKTKNYAYCEYVNTQSCGWCTTITTITITCVAWPPFMLPPNYILKRWPSDWLIIFVMVTEMFFLDVLLFAIGLPWY